MDEPASPESTTNLSVTIVCLNALGVIQNRDEKNIGGMEVRAWMIARGLAKFSGANVTFIVRSESQVHETIEQVQVCAFDSRWNRILKNLSPYLTRSYAFPGITIHRWGTPLISGLTQLAMLRLFAPSDKRLEFEKTLRESSSDLFVAFGVSYFTRFTIELAKSLGKKSAVMIAWDGDLDERNQPGTGYISQFGDRADDTWWILKNADQVIVQTSEQLKMLKDHFGRAGVILENPIDVDWWLDRKQRTDLLPAELSDAKNYWLWVGRSEREHKRPQLLIELAKERPDEQFLMILNPRDQTLEQEIRHNKPDNVTIIPSVPYDLMPPLFGHAKGFINTSSQEGFANTFLQAAICQVPIVSLNVGGPFFKESGAGICAEGDWNRFVSSTRLPPVVTEQSVDYVRSRHGWQAVNERLTAFLTDLKSR